MSLNTLRERLRTAREDDRVTRAEVESLIRAAFKDGQVNHQEALILRAEVDAHGELFDPDAREALIAFLDANPPR